MIDTMRDRLKNDKEIPVLSLLSLISVLFGVIDSITTSVSYTGTFSALYFGRSFLNWCPNVLFLIFILLKYKTGKNRLFVITFIFRCALFVLNTMTFIPLESMLKIVMLPADICILVFAVKGVKNITIAKVLCIVQIILNVFLMPISLLPIGFLFGSGIVARGATILFWIVVLRILPAVIKIKEEKMLMTQKLLSELKEGYESGLLTEQEYHDKKAEILNTI